MRKPIERNEIGQFKGHGKAYYRAGELATQFFEEFPETDASDLFVILVSAANFAKSMLILKEAENFPPKN